MGTYYYPEGDKTENQKEKYPITDTSHLKRRVANIPE